MSVVQLDVQDRRPFSDGERFGGEFTYERIDGIAYYAVDPLDEANATVVDLAHAERDADGLVRFSGDFTILAPVGGGISAALLDVPNRGHRVSPRMFNRAPLSEDHFNIDPGDGLLLRRGWTMAFCGWQYDVPDGQGRMGLDPPHVAEPDGGAMQMRFQVGSDQAELLLTDQHVGVGPTHKTLPPSIDHMSEAKLLVRDTPYGEASLIDPELWNLSDDHITLANGFERGRIYDLIYRPRDCPVVGAGMLAIRDFAIAIKSDASPATPVDHVIGEGVSQCGRFLRTYLYNGLNTNEGGDVALDGLLIHVAGGRRGEFNHRFGQPSVQPTPSFGHLFPHADLPQTDPSGTEAGLLDRQAARGGMPKIFYTDTSAEYWRGDAGLTHTDIQSGADVELPDNARRYLFASTQHGSGMLPQVDESPYGRAANGLNVIDYRPLIRAALVNLLDWIRTGEEPPASVYPRWSDGTAAHRNDVIQQLSNTIGLDLPDPEALNRIRPLDLGETAAIGVGAHPARSIGAGYESPVSAIGPDGNEVGGVSMPDVTYPVGTHTGFNPRHADAGAPGQLLEYVGSTSFMAPSDIRARYGDLDSYLERIESAARDLVSERYLLEEDIDLCVKIARKRYEAATG